MPKSYRGRPRGGFLGLALTAAVIGLLGQPAARATTFMGFFPTIPTPGLQPPPPGGDNQGNPPVPETVPTIPPIFNWTEPPPGGGGDQPGPPAIVPPATVSSAPEPATGIGSLIGMGGTRSGGNVAATQIEITNWLGLSRA